MSIVERYLIQCPLFGVSIKRNSTVIPYEAWFGEKPLKHLGVFSCDAYVHIPKDERSKLDTKARKFNILVNPKGRLYHSEQSKIIIR